MDEKSQGNWIEIARVGRFRDSAGAWHDFSQSRLEKMVADYQPDKREAPLVIGHPATNGPAHGWIKSLKTRGSKLLAFPAYVSDQVRQAVDNGLYRHVSMSLYQDGGLRHVGLLGAHPPAIDGLAPVSFSADAATVIDFEPMEQTKSPGEGNQMTIEELTRQVAELQGQLTKLTQEKEAAVKEAAALKEELAKTKTDGEKVLSEFTAFRHKCDNEILTRRIDRLVQDGKVAPAEKSVVSKTAEALRRGGPYDFACGEEQPLETYLVSLEARQPSELFQNFSAPDGREGNGFAQVTKPLSAKL